MSRHRNVRSMDYKEEYDGYDDVFGHSVDDEGCISPTDAQQWLYDRARGQQSIATFMASNRDIQEEDEGGDGEEHEKERRDSESYQLPELPEEEMARLKSCMDEIRSIVGDSVTERRLVETIMNFHYDMEKSLDSILNPTSQTTAGPAPKAAEKESSSNIEKDCDSVPREASQTFSNLSDLINSRMDTNRGGAKRFSLPKLNASAGGTTSKFVLPKLSNIPKISPQRVKVEELKVEKMSLNETEESSVENSGWIIDLTTALISGGDGDGKAGVREVDDDDFIPHFVECDIESEFLAGSIAQYCEIDLSPLLRQKLRQRTKKSSKLGGILCRRFKKGRIPSIMTKFDQKHHIEPFKFETQSPDDYCLKFLKR